MGETIHVRTEGGSVVAMDLPLGEGIAKRYADGQIVRVNPDGSPWTEQEPADPDPVERPDRPADSAPVAAWRDHARAVGGPTAGDVDAMTKPQLIDRFGGS